jgi:hypothetical protein
MKIDIHSRHSGLDAAALRKLEQRVRAILSPFAHRLAEVRLRLTDQNGPRGAEDLLCVATARTDRGSSFAVRSLTEPKVGQVTPALRRLRRWVRKSIERGRGRHRSTRRGG